MRRWLWALSVLAIVGVSCAGVIGMPGSRPLSSTPAADGGPSEVEAATLTAITILVLATPTGPPATATSRPAPTEPPPTPLPAIVFLDDWKCAKDRIGRYRFEGKVTNTTTNRTFSSVRVRGSVRLGSVTNDNFSYIDSDALRPGQTSTFSVSVTDPDPSALGGAQCYVAIDNYRG